MSWRELMINQLAEVYAGSPWYGKPVRTILEEVIPEKAGICPDASSHSIYQLLLHMLAWRTFVVERLKGNEAYSVTVDTEQDWNLSAVLSSESWQAQLSRFDENQKELLAVVNSFPEKNFEEKVPGLSVNFRQLIEGIVHHDIYHAGQIVTMAKITEAYRPKL